MYFYNESRSTNYDDRSNFDKGERANHASYLKDILSYIDNNSKYIVELGCGTGFYTTCILDVCKKANLLCVDGSKYMMEIFENKYKDNKRVKTKVILLEEFKMDCAMKPDIIFSGVTLSCMVEEDRKELTKDIYKSLSDNGSYILFDQFSPDDKNHFKLNLNLICKDMQRRMHSYLSIPLDNPMINIDRLITSEVDNKEKDGDKDSSIEKNIEIIKDAGFESVQLVFMEPRLFGVVANKIEGSV